MAPPPPPPPPLQGKLFDDVIGEILVRIPPDEPEHLFRAALVSKQWLRIIASAAFKRRYGEFHKVPPLLGVILNISPPDRYTPPPHRFTPTTARPAFTLPVTTSLPYHRHIDCRHGRVLTSMEVAPYKYDYLIWNPITRVTHRVEAGCFYADYAAVFCAAAGCNHQACHDGTFRVVETTNLGYSISVKVYSSATKSWSDNVTIETEENSLLNQHRAALVGNDVFLHIIPGGIVKYNMLENSVSMDKAALPVICGRHQITLMEVEDRCLGLVSVVNLKLYVWTKVSAEWLQYRVIDLLSVPSMSLTRSSFAEVCGFAEGVGKIFLSTESGLFMMGMDSEPVWVDKEGYYRRVLPYLSFYLPDTSNAVQQVMLTINATTGLERPQDAKETGKHEQLGYLDNMTGGKGEGSCWCISKLYRQPWRSSGTRSSKGGGKEALIKGV